MRKWIWATFEALVGFWIGGVLGWWIAFGILRIIEAAGSDPPREVREAILLSVAAWVGIGGALFFARRAVDAYEGRARPGRAVLTGKGGKPELTGFSLLAFGLLAMAWAFWVMTIQSWGRH